MHGKVGSTHSNFFFHSKYSLYKSESKIKGAFDRIVESFDYKLLLKEAETSVFWTSRFGATIGVVEWKKYLNYTSTVTKKKNVSIELLDLVDTTKVAKVESYESRLKVLNYLWKTLKRLEVFKGTFSPGKEQDWKKISRFIHRTIK